MPCGKESSPRIAIGRKLLTEDPSCEAEDMTAPETFTAASKRPLTTGRRPDMTAICAFETFEHVSNRRQAVIPDPRLRAATAQRRLATTGDMECN
jgi:hypothetical protein